MVIGIIGAMQMEIDNLKEAMTDTTVSTYSGVEFVKGNIDGKEVVAAVCGIGKVFAAICAEAMILKFDVDMIVNIGVAGSLTKDLSVLDIAVAKNVVQHDMDTSAIGDPVGLLSGINTIFLDANKSMNEVLCKCIEEKEISYKLGTIATGDQFIAKKEQKDLIKSRFEAIAAEMEGGSIGHVCFINNVPFAILRSISDSEGGAMDYETFAEKAAVQSIEVVLDFIKKADEISLA
ncbi:MAG: 5'-methylthioadenosine/adenosylhomocysteine nucleosidase [Agathobacter sp.]|nr:5'-methylthioadenosine/adenosylhomocysteine nucleosidase [Agathobacter sp.]